MSPSVRLCGRVVSRLIGISSVRRAKPNRERKQRVHSSEDIPDVCSLHDFHNHLTMQIVHDAAPHDAARGACRKRVVVDEADGLQLCS